MLKESHFSKLEQLELDAIELARREINEFALPPMILYDLSLAVGERLAVELGAIKPLVSIGVAMMDLKLGLAFQQKQLDQHIAMSRQAALEFLAQYNIETTHTNIIINAIEAHHGTIPFTSLEAEICANADCYRFIHPKGVFAYLTILGKRLDSFRACLDQAEAKMDEKIKIVSLPLVKAELLPYYEKFKEYFSLARSL